MKRKGGRLMEGNDSLLVERARAGDSAAFDELVARHRARMHRQLYRMCMDTEQVEDTVQETFLQAFRALNQFRGLSAFSTWLYRIAHNICLRKRQQARRETPVSLDEMTDGDEENAPREAPDDDPQRDPARVLLSRELQDAMDQAVRDLPDAYKPVFILREIEELPTQQVSEALGLTEAAVKARLHRARAFLKERLTPYLNA
ncbi:MAG: sigma-70 family RNA polymerase sigma factor [Armatimonadota bacterium]|nr:sigma-70 family RNA polymerase sigma factor [Armatimonadota bacterium]